MSGILIVDDMPVIRSALVSILSEQNRDHGAIWEAANGEEAVQLARIHKPDIILMDIKMPGVTGLQATAVIRREQPDAKIIILTAYNEFAYVQKALKLGARDYLLKPVRPNKLLELLAEIYQEIEQERRDLRTVEIVKDSLQKTLPVIETNLVENLIRGTQPEGSSAEESLAYLGKRLIWPVVLVTKIDGFDALSQVQPSAAMQQLVSSLTKIIRQELPDPHRALVGYSNPGRVVVIVSTEMHLATASQLRVWGEKIRTAVANTLPFTVTIGMGKRYMALESIPLSYAEANLARRYHSHFQGNVVVGIDDLEDLLPSTNDRGLYLVQKERELTQLVQTNQQQEAQKLVNHIVDYLSQQYSSSPDAIKNHCAELMTLVAWGVVGAGVNDPKVLNLLQQQARALASWRTIPEIRAWTLNSLAEMMTFVQAMSQRQNTVQDALAYIHENYHRPDISLQEVAEAVNLSSSHFSSQFKTAVGVSYVKYLTSMRLKEAQKLLRTTDYNITTVAEMVGYPNATNFYRHFQRHIGMTPAAYREAIVS
ncbi:MAG: response regulator [Chloroflexi bacterium]|nr:response regulator [Chloroflexota bacterium]MBK6709051.1 response regulator [Chloroflexota bacterium]MBP7590520.1 response regulator [Chloroflexota bacterium]